MRRPIICVTPLETRDVPSVSLVGSEFRANTYTTNAQNQPAVAMDAIGNMVVVWESLFQDGGANGVFAQRFDASGVPVGPEFQVNTITTNNQMSPHVAMEADGDFVVVWLASQQDTGTPAYPDGIYARRYSATGVPLAPEFLVSDSGDIAYFRPRIATDPQGNVAVVTWYQADNSSGATREIYGRWLNYGVPVGSSIQINVTTTGNQESPSVAIDASGDAVIVWGSRLPNRVYARQFAASGTPASGEILVQPITTGNQFSPAVAVQAGGEFLVAWNGTVASGPLVGAYVRHFDANGTASGPTLRLDSALNDSSASIDLGAGPNGDWVAVFAQSNAVNARRVAADGTPQGQEVTINSTAFTGAVVNSPTVAYSPGGRVAVAWANQNLDGSNYGAYVHRLTTLPRIQSVIINDGDTQRSRVTTVHVTFNQHVTFAGNPMAAFDLRRQSDDAIVVLGGTIDDTGSGTIATLTFANGPLDYGSLADGRYTLTVLASQMSSGTIDGNGDGVPGDNYQLIGTPANGLFRLFSDSDGNGTVNAIDFAAFRGVFGTSGLSIFDFNNDGVVNATDFAQFRGRFGISLTP